MSWKNLPMSQRTRLRQIVLERDQYRCQLRLPGCTLTATQADHVHPRETHGDGPENLRAACRHCNISRGKPGRNDPDPISRW